MILQSFTNKYTEEDIPTKWHMQLPVRSRFMKLNLAHTKGSDFLVFF